MKPKQLGRELAREQQIPRAAAQDEVDEVVAGIVRKLRAGEQVLLPGMGEVIQREPRTEGKGAANKRGPRS